jgi:hypothetical protein
LKYSIGTPHVLAPRAQLETSNPFASGKQARGSLFFFYTAIKGAPRERKNRSKTSQNPGCATAKKTKAVESLYATVL